MNIRHGLLALTAAAAMAAVPVTAMAAVDSFIWIEGAQGNSTDAGHKGWFEIRQFSLGAASQSPAASGAGAGKARANDFTITRVTDSASPSFFRQAVSTGKHFGQVKIQMRKAGGKPDEYVTYVFSNVTISRMDASGRGEQGPEETLTFVYGAMSVQYSEQSAPAPSKGLSPPVRTQPTTR